MEVGEEDETENIIHMIFSLKKKKKVKAMCGVRLSLAVSSLWWEWILNN